MTKTKLDVHTAHGVMNQRLHVAAMSLFEKGLVSLANLIDQLMLPPVSAW